MPVFRQQSSSTFEREGTKVIKRKKARKKNDEEDDCDWTPNVEELSPLRQSVEYKQQGKLVTRVLYHNVFIIGQPVSH